jgi:protein-L-isoaspartate(D-aspartate) O-methyltransferase
MRKEVVMRGLLGALFAVGLLALCACQERPTGVAATPDPAREATAAPQVTGQGDEELQTARRMRLVEQGIVGMGISDPAVIEAMRAVPRHRFVRPEYLEQAYGNHPLPIGYGQTISQPYIVALMTEALDLKTGDRVLEIGTGSGYQAAVLAEIVEQVYTIEIIGALADQSDELLQALGYHTVEVRHADGYYGWEEHAPFDAIIVTAAPDHVPPPLRAQLADGGRLVIPVGPVGGYQELWLVERHGDEFTTRSLGGVRFVPFTREARDQ